MPVTGSIIWRGLPSAPIFTPVATWQFSALLFKNRNVFDSPVQGLVVGWFLNHAPPIPAKNTPRIPPMTPIGVSAASISGKRSSALAKTTFCPANWRKS